MFVDFEPWHLTKMRLSDTVRDFLGKFPARNQIGRLAARGLAFTSVSGEEILGVVGANPRNEKTAEVFLIMSKDGKRHTLELVKDVRRVLAVARKQFATIEALGEDSPRINRWLSCVGFIRRSKIGPHQFMWRLV